MKHCPIGLVEAPSETRARLLHPFGLSIFRDLVVARRPLIFRA